MVNTSIHPLGVSGVTETLAQGIATDRSQCRFRVGMRLRSLTASIAVLASAGCSDASGPARWPTIADLAGRWTLTAWEAVSVADTTQRLDLRAQLNAVATIDIAADGSAIFTASVYGQAPTVQHVTLSLVADTLVYHEIAGDARFVLDGTRDHMWWRGVVPQYQDVDGDGVPEETRTWMEFVRS
jgi:hypothetical protein